MSASREKKQRQTDPDGRLTQKQLREQKEAQAQKRKTILYSVIAAAAAVLVAALLIWNSGFFQGRTTAATVNGQAYTPADVSYYYHTALNQEYMYAQYGISSFDASVDPKEQYTDAEQTTSYYDQFVDSALDQLTRITALVDAARADGFTADDEVRTYVDTQLSTVDSSAAQYNRDRASYLKAVYGKYMTVARFKTCLEREALANAYYSAHQDALTYDSDALERYYEENKNTLDTFDYSLCFINGKAADPTDANGDPVKDEDGNAVTATEEEQTQAMAAAREKAQAMVDALKAGGSFDTLAAEAVAGDEKSTNSGEQTLVGNSIPALLMDWLCADGRQTGDVDLVESEGNGYYVIRFENRYRDEESRATADVRHILIKAELAEGAEAPTDEAMEATKEKAQSLLDQWKAGDATAESFGELANANSDDPGSNTNGGLYEGVTRGQFFTAFNDWIFDASRKEGDTTLIENPQSGQQGWHVVYLEKLGDIQWSYTAANALKSDDMKTWITDLESSYVAETGSGIDYITA